MGSSPSAPARSEKRALFHLGAPFTGAAGLHRTLHSHRDTLAQRGLAILLPSDIPNAQATELGATALRAGAQGLMISHESALGPPGRQGFYEAATDTLPAYLAALSPWPVTLALAVRHPLDWLLARYAHVLGRTAPPPEAFFVRHTPDCIDWVSLARRLIALPGVDSLRVWRCESHARDLRGLTHSLTGHTLPGRAPPPRGLSIRAVEAILAGTAPDQARLDHPLGPNPRFDPFGPDVWAEADLIYDRQWTAIAQLPKTQRLFPARP